ESDIIHPSRTPFLAEGVYFFAWPKETDSRIIPSGRQEMNGAVYGGMTWLAIARHGNRPNPVSDSSWPANQRAPGAINVSLYDGHVEQVACYRLWGFEWHKNWKATMQPGLQGSN